MDRQSAERHAVRHDQQDIGAERDDRSIGEFSLIAPIIPLPCIEHRAPYRKRQTIGGSGSSNNLILIA
jgi:hypothetical protein